MKKKNESIFPGFLGLTSKGIIGIHADWPMYPEEHGWELALLSLGYHPPKTIFHQLDDIDRCILLIAGDVPEGKDPYDENFFHVAIWHEDILQLSFLGFVTGVLGMTEYEWDLHRFNQIPPGAGIFLNDEFIPLSPPTPPDPDDDDYDYINSSSFALVEESGLIVTDEGYKTLHKMLFDEKEYLNPGFMAQIQPLIDVGRYDAAIRDASILVETKLRGIVKTDGFGMTLVDRYFKILFDSNKYIPAKLKVFRAEIKTAFKFIRNEYAHNLKRIELDQCYAILWRLSAIYTELEGFVF
jgi:hypothetical protein